MNIVIIGNGISGISTARWLRKLSDHKITVISSESDHFYSRTALMYIYMGHMRYKDTKPYEDYFWEKNRINLVNDHVDGVDYQNKTLSLKKGKTLQYDKLVLALGSKSNKFGWPGQDLNRVTGLYNLQDLEKIESFSEGLNRAVIVGGGLIGIELAEMFHSRHIPVTMFVREASFWDAVLPIEESQMITRHILKNGIDLRLGTNLKEIVDDGNGNACAAVAAESGEKVDCGYVGLTAGVSPNVGWLKESGLEINRGIVVNDKLETNQSDVYAIGDCAEQANPLPGRRGVEAIWYTGRMMGETCAYNICGHDVSYDPGIWFNSAKFIDIEYQVYGEVLAKPKEHHKALYWEHEDGEKSVRILYDVNDQSIVGFNLMGIRFRHEVCEKWLREKTNVKEVIANLTMANFDPEFYKKYEEDIAKSFSSQCDLSFSNPKKSNLDRVLSFLKA